MPAILRLCNNLVPTGNQFSNSSAENFFADIYNFPANTDSGYNAGRRFQLKAYGYFSSIGSSPGTLTLKYKLTSVNLAASEVISLPTSASNTGFMIDADATLCTSGTSGFWDGQGMVSIGGGGANYGMVNTGTGTSGQLPVNTQNSNILRVSSQFSVADPGNIITLTKLILVEWT